MDPALAHGVPVLAPDLCGRVIFDQRWCDAAFLHWPVDPSAVARWMPPGARPDVIDGMSWVGLIPFRMVRARIGARIPAPYIGSFGEVNVRIYSVDDSGRHGVVFRSLDCSRAAVVAAARAIGVPYVWSRVGSEPYASTGGVPFPDLPVGTERVYDVRRHRGGPASRLRLTVGAAVEPTPLEIFLTARWGMHSTFAGRPVWVPNQHGSWPLHSATVTEFADGLVAAAGIEPVGPMLRALWSPGVHARFGPPVVGPRRR